MKFKKAFMPLIAGALALGLAACGGDDKAADKDKEADIEDVEEVEVDEEEQAAAAAEMQAKLAEQQVEDDLVVAIVNKEELLGEEYNAALSSIQGQMQQMGADPTSDEASEQIKAQTLDAVINQKLILQQAKEAKLDASEEEIDEEYQTFVAQFGDEDTFKEALEAQDLELEEFKQQINNKIISEKYQEKVSPVEEATDEEIKAYYEQAEAESKESGQELPPFEDVSEEIKDILTQNKQQDLLMAHVQELKEKADIELKI